MPTISAQKVRGFLGSPRTYPRSGLGFGLGGGAISAAKPNMPNTTNRISVKGTTGKLRPVSHETAIQKVKADFQTKSADFKGTGMLEKIKQLALEKCAGDEEKALEFLEGFYEELLTKSAAFGFNVSDLAGEFTKGIGKGLAGVTLGLGVSGLATAAKSIANSKMHNQFVEALRRAISMNPILRQAKQEKVMNYAETIFKFAPHVATDANLLSSILANAVHGEGIDPQTIRTLTELESRYAQTSSASSFSPKAYV
jgi:hypothetical protein